MDTDNWTALGAFAVSLFSIALHLWLRWSDQKTARHASVISAQQGTKEAVGYEAHRIATDGWPKDRKERARIREALCLAFVFEPSDRSRALIYEAVKKADADDKSDLVRQLTSLISTFRNLERDTEWDLHRAWPKIAILGTALGAPDITTSAKQALQEGIDARKLRPPTA
jgi:hypothetical protein